MNLIFSCDLQSRLQSRNVIIFYCKNVASSGYASSSIIQRGKNKVNFAGAGSSASGPINRSNWKRRTAGLSDAPAEGRGLNPKGGNRYWYFYFFMTRECLRFRVFLISLLRKLLKYRIILHSESDHTLDKGHKHF